MAAQIKCISPIDGSIYAERPVLSPEAASAVVERAQQAQTSWAARPLQERIDLVLAGVAAVGAMNDEIVTELAWQMGRPIRYGGEFGGFEERATHMAAIAQSSLTPIEISDDDQFRRRIKRVPHGVVLVVAPWNYPYMTAINTVAPALIAGNAGGSETCQSNAVGWRTHGPGFSQRRHPRRYLSKCLSRPPDHIRPDRGPQFWLR